MSRGRAFSEGRVSSDKTGWMLALKGMMRGAGRYRICPSVSHAAAARLRGPAL